MCTHAELDLTHGMAPARPVRSDVGSTHLALMAYRAYNSSFLIFSFSRFNSLYRSTIPVQVRHLPVCSGDCAGDRTVPIIDWRCCGCSALAPDERSSVDKAKQQRTRAAAPAPGAGGGDQRSKASVVEAPDDEIENTMPSSVVNGRRTASLPHADASDVANAHLTAQ